MFTSQLPDVDYRVVFSEYTKRHFIKRFSKSYPGKQWEVTQQSIFDSLRRVHTIQQTQQVDELKTTGSCLLYKYDFAVAKTNVSARASGNRCLVYLDGSRYLQTVLLVYGKGDLPKKQPETVYLLQTVEREFPELWERLKETK